MNDSNAPAPVSTDERTFPADDVGFEEYILTEVRAGDDGWELGHDGWWFWCPNTSPIEPRPGMTARFYGKGRIRGLFLNGRKVFYNTEAEDKERFEIELYGADAADWLARWDAGKTVWSISMGGMGPGYEQCIHITCAELVREMLNGGYERDKWYVEGDEGKAVWKRDRERIDKKVTALAVIDALGLSGAQWGAAMNLAGFMVRHGPRVVMSDEDVKDRHIQVRKSFP